MWSVRFVCHSFCHSVCEQDYCSSNQRVWLVLWLGLEELINFWWWFNPRYFTHHCVIPDSKRFVSIGWFLRDKMTCADKVLNSIQTYRSKPQMWIQLPLFVCILALAGLSCLSTVYTVRQKNYTLLFLQQLCQTVFW